MMCDMNAWSFFLCVCMCFSGEERPNNWPWWMYCVTCLSRDLFSSTWLLTFSFSHLRTIHKCVESKIYIYITSSNIHSFFFANIVFLLFFLLLISWLCYILSSYCLIFLVCVSYCSVVRLLYCVVLRVHTIVRWQ